MPRNVMMEQFHVTLRVAEDMPDREVSAIRRTIDGGRFQAALQRSFRTVLKRFPALAKVRLALSR